MIVKGAVIAFTNDWAFVDLGGKTEGLLPIEELKNKMGELEASIGDPVEAFIISTRGGEVRLSHRLSETIRDFDALKDAYHAGIPVEGRVVASNKGGFEVMVAGRRAFCPISQIDLSFVENPDLYIGQSYRFMVTELSNRGKRLVVSRTRILKEERKALKEALKETIGVGDVMSGRVSSLQEYGAFIDLGGIEGLAHISELSWRRLEHPSEALSVGDEVEVKILEMKIQNGKERISLSVRAVQPHPWVAVGSTFIEGETYEGTVTKLEPFGAFVELGPGIEGLVHLSELSWERRINHANEMLSVGEKILVYLKQIDHEKRRIALSVKALESDPWLNVAQRYPEGSAATGTIERIEPFGLFVQLEPGLVGLIPGSESGVGSGQDMKREFQLEQKITATVLSIDSRKRRMSLSLTAKEVAESKEALKSFMDNQAKNVGGSGLGTLGDLFAEKLKKNS
jgi:small subunit ribosomal protein S1